MDTPGRGGAGHPWRHPLALAAILVAYNTGLPLAPWGLQERVYVPANLLATGLLLWWATRKAGLGWEELGLGPRGALRSGVVGALVGLALGGPLLALALSPAPLPSPLQGLSLPAPGLPSLLYQVGVRIPLGTALFEETAFRGVLHGLLRARTSPVRAALMGSVAFSLWHLGPTLRRFQELGLPQEVPLLAGAWAAALGGTFLGGLFFIALRERTRHLAGPTMAHWFINALALTASALRP